MYIVSTNFPRKIQQPQFFTPLLGRFIRIFQLRDELSFFLVDVLISTFFLKRFEEKQKKSLIVRSTRVDVNTEKFRELKFSSFFGCFFSVLTFYLRFSHHF